MFQQLFNTIQQYTYTLQHSQPHSQIMWINSILVFNIRSELFKNVSFSTNCKKISTSVKVVKHMKVFSTMSQNCSTKFKTPKLTQIFSTGTTEV